MSKPQIEPWDGQISVYSNGVVCCSVCAPATMSGEEVARRTNLVNPAGTRGGWSVSTERTFADGTPMPAACNTDPGRRHWLLNC